MTLQMTVGCPPCSVYVCAMCVQHARFLHVHTEALEPTHGDVLNLHTGGLSLSLFPSLFISVLSLLISLLQIQSSPGCSSGAALQTPWGNNAPRLGKKRSRPGGSPNSFGNNEHSKKALWPRENHTFASFLKEIHSEVVHFCRFGISHFFQRKV